jgi:flagellar protein FlgJ
MNPLLAVAAERNRSTAPAALPDRLRRTAARLEGVFVEQMFKAMRETVPHDGVVDGGSGEEMFTSLFDQKLADRAPSQWQHGLGSAIVKALRERAAVAPSAATPPASASDPSTIPRLTTPERR